MKNIDLIGPGHADAQLTNCDCGEQRGCYIAETESAKFFRADPEADAQRCEDGELGILLQRNNQPIPHMRTPKSFARRPPLTATAANRLVRVEHLLNTLADLWSSSTPAAASTRALGGVNSPDATNPISSSFTSLLRRTSPIGSRVLRTMTTPAFAAFFAASSAGEVMLPSPTPAMTMPFAPFFTAASIRSALMFACA